jgi:hypothetical protein
MEYRLNHRPVVKIRQPQPSTKEEVFQFPKPTDESFEEVEGDSDFELITFLSAVGEDKVCPSYLND